MTLNNARSSLLLSIYDTTEFKALTPLHGIANPFGYVTVGNEMSTRGKYCT